MTIHLQARCSRRDNFIVSPHIGAQSVDASRTSVFISLLKLKRLLVYNSENSEEPGDGLSPGSFH